MKSQNKRLTAIYTILAAIAWLVLSPLAQAATTLLPNGKQCFSNANGPLISGSINMFFVGTTNPKPTWQDSNQTTLNSQPLQLDGAGCAVLYGIGSYRQQVFDGPVVAGSTTGTLVWDQITTDTSAYNAVFWAGINGGTPNVVTVVDPGFNGTDGSVINYTALATNTGSVTVNPSGFGPVLVVKDTAAGPVVLTGGEIVQNNIVSLIYNAAGNQFHLVNTAIPSASGNTSPLCGATNLKITNNAGTPSTIVTVTADTALMINPAGLVINRTNITQNINLSTGTITSAASGMDAEAPGTNAWIYIWLIDNGASPSGLASLAAGNGLAPVMPSGYTYKCRMGAMRVDVAGNLLRTLQRGALAQYRVTTPSNTTAMPIISSGAIGNSATPVYVSTPVSTFFPPTASSSTTVFMSGAASEAFVMAPNGNYGSVTSTTNPPPCGGRTSAGTTSPGPLCTMLFESSPLVIFYANGGTASDALFAFGWQDQINAN